MITRSVSASRPRQTRASRVRGVDSMPSLTAQADSACAHRDAACCDPWTAMLARDGARWRWRHRGALLALRSRTAGVADRPDWSATRRLDTRRASRCPPGFLGVSLEYQAAPRLHRTRPDARSTRCWSQLIRDLAPGQPPVLRIGGDSTDSTWWPMRGVIPPRRRQLRADQGLAADDAARWPQTLGAKLILGRQPRRRTAGARGRRGAGAARGHRRGATSTAFEIGNEPDLYGDVRRGTATGRGQRRSSPAPARYGLDRLHRASSRTGARRSRSVPLAGPGVRRARRG